jgi:hypothetical protein
MPPSDIAILMAGNFWKIGVHMRSLRARNEFIGVIEIMTSAGASVAVSSSEDDEPMCRHTTVRMSEHAFQNGSQ